MADIAWTDVTAFAAGLSAVDVLAQTDILAHVNVVLDVEMFGGEDAPKTRLARIYLAAHMGSSISQAASGASGPVIEQKMGQSSLKFASAASGQGLASTAWGRLYEQLSDTTIWPGLIV